MPTFSNLHISDSLYALITANASKSKCCKTLASVLERLSSSSAPKGDCPCPECKKARKGVTLLNPKLIGNYFSFREKPGMISYMPKGKTQETNEDGQWVRKGRVEIKPDKWIKSMLHPKLAAKLKDHEFTFGTIVKAEEEALKITFKLVSFENAYNARNYSEETRPESCMWGKDVGDFYRILGAKALVAMNGKGIYVGRAVLWPNVKRENGEVIQLLDRIYTRNPETTTLFKAHAKEKGWYWKYKQNRSNLLDVVDPEKEDVHNWVLTVESSEEFDKDLYFPFLDTFQGGRDNQSVVNVNRSEGEKVFTRFSYASTNGVREEFQDRTGQVITIDGVWIPEEDSCYVDGYGTLPMDDPRVRQCHHTNRYYLKDYCVYIAHEDFWVHRDYQDQYLTPEEKEAKVKKEKAALKAAEKRKAERMKMEGNYSATMRNSGSYCNDVWIPLSIGRPAIADRWNIPPPPPPPPQITYNDATTQGTEDLNF